MADSSASSRELAASAAVLCIAPVLLAARYLLLQAGVGRGVRKAGGAAGGAAAGRRRAAVLPSRAAVLPSRVSSPLLPCSPPHSSFAPPRRAAGARPAARPAADRCWLARCCR